MIKPSKPDNEHVRLEALRRLRILDTPREAAFDDLVAIASAVCNTPMGSVSLIDAERQWFKASVGLQDQETPRDQALCAHAILQPEQVMVVPDALQDPRFRDNPAVTGGARIRFYAGAPLIASDGSALGTLCVMDEQPREIQPAQLRALEALARQVTRLLEMRDLNRQFGRQMEDRNWYEQELDRYQHALETQNADLMAQTRTDRLTGLANRRAFALALESALASDRPCSVALLDLDHFKTVNDVHGHAAGDRVLAEVAAQLRGAAGGHGLVARMGGEEFVWLMQDAPAQTAELQCRYLCETVRSASLSLPVTLSVGLAHRRPDESAEHLLERADLALYAAKRNGRDRVEVAD